MKRGGNRKPGGLLDTLDRLIRAKRNFTQDDIRMLCTVPISPRSTLCQVARAVREGRVKVVFNGRWCRKKSVYRGVRV